MMVPAVVPFLGTNDDNDADGVGALMMGAGSDGANKELPNGDD